jgi:Outer membrane protein and related peptidoglycan-associated (lipo)proteins
MNRTLTAIAAAAAALLSVQSVAAQNSQEWEFGAGTSAVNLTRTIVTNFHQTKGGDYIFNVEEKFVHGGADLYAARMVKDWLYVDAQGTLGFVRGDGDDSRKHGMSWLVGPGVQFRPLVSSRWIQPYARVGVNYYGKNFKTRYFGQFDGDVTKEGVWKAEDAWNKGMTFDRDHYLPVSLGVGVIGWISDCFGIHIQGQYLRSVILDGPDFAQVSLGALVSLGGESRKRSVADSYVRAHPDDFDAFFAGRLPAPEPRIDTVEVVRERLVVDTVKAIGESSAEIVLADLFESINFEFDKAILTPESIPALDRIAETLAANSEMRFLIAGYTDAKGSDRYNDSLSDARARAVFNALILRGVPDSMLCARGFGKRASLVSASASDGARRGDRKVVIERVMGEEFWNYLKNKNE